MARPLSHPVIHIMLAKEKSFGTMMGLLVEQLRYAQVVSVIKETEYDYTLRIYPPRSVDANYWAKSNVDRMKSFGLRAEVVLR